MANITISNNGTQARSALYNDDGTEYAPAVLATPTLKLTDKDGNVTIIRPETSVGVAIGEYKLEIE